MLRTYDPKAVAVIVGGVPITGFADGSFVTVERTAETFTKVSGADGVVSRAKSNDRSGSITIVLAQTSPSNKILSGIQLLDEMSNTGVVPVAVQDFSGFSLAAASHAWIQKPPSNSFGKEITDREWVLDCADLAIYTGGNADAE